MAGPTRSRLQTEERRIRYRCGLRGHGESSEAAKGCNRSRQVAAHG